jgi:hypothetical protein
VGRRPWMSNEPLLVTLPSHLHHHALPGHCCHARLSKCASTSVQLLLSEPQLDRTALQRDVLRRGGLQVLLGREHYRVLQWREDEMNRDMCGRQVPIINVKECSHLHRLPLKSGTNRKTRARGEAHTLLLDTAKSTAPRVNS